jgi:hypothetical protein
VEFLAFMDGLVDTIPGVKDPDVGLELHVVMDNYCIHDATVISRREIHDEEPEGVPALQSGRMVCHTPITGTLDLHFSLPEVSDQGVLPAPYCRSDLLRFRHT